MNNKTPCHRYTPEQEKWLRDNVKGRLTAELAKLFNAHFGTDLNENQIHCKKKAMKLKSGVSTRFSNGEASYPRGVGYQHYYSTEQIAWIKQNKHLTNWKLAEEFEKVFGVPRTARQIEYIKSKHKITGAEKGGGACRFKTGFRKGNKPPQWRPIGSTRQTQGYTEIKIRDGKGKKNWERLHIAVWEQANGPVPDGKCLIFLDGNKNNVSLENLELVDRATLVRLNQKQLIFKNPEATKTGILIATLLNRAGTVKRKLEGQSDEKRRK